MSKFFSVKNPNCKISVSESVMIQDNVTLGPKCKKITIGYGSFLGRDIYIDVEELEIGEYTTIHHGCILSGVKTKIGHNCWFGHYTIIDSLGGETLIGNNVGVGAHSQLWSHMKFGDVLAGCKWNSSGKLILEDDVWLVGHSITGPIIAKSKSMLMTGGVALKDMEENSIYAGSPAVNITEKMGRQFYEKSSGEIIKGFKGLVKKYHLHTNENTENLVVVNDFDYSRNDITQFIPERRLYLPIRSSVEVDFIKYCLYDKAKFIPVNKNDCI